jgi:hypothetical protein
MSNIKSKNKIKKLDGHKKFSTERLNRKEK